MPLLLAYICYLLLGATIFQLLEKQAEAQSRDQFQLEKLRFLENYTCLDQQALEQFVQVREQGRMGQEERGGGWRGPVAGQRLSVEETPEPWSAGPLCDLDQVT